MWGMMRLTPFGAAFPGTQPGAAQGFVPSLSMMSDMMAPLTNVEELDKRITDMRAVEQWLKLNLNMLQSAIQALEVQRATLATLRAFGAFAQQSMSQPVADVPPHAQTAAQERAGDMHAATGSRADEARESEPSAQEGAQASGESAPPPGFDASGWWNLLQSQFNQIAQFAMAQPGMAAGGAGGSASGEGGEGADREAAGRAAAGSGGAEAEARANRGGRAERGTGTGAARQPAAKRPAAKRTSAAAKAAKASKEGKGAGAAARKTPDQPE
jgi:hypothetical protein